VAHCAETGGSSSADAAGVSVEAATLEGREQIGASLGFASREMGEAP